MYNGRIGVVTDENGLYQMRARYYNPVIRQFINQDLLMGNITNSQSLNRYSYCQGNPVNYLDPFGLEPYNAFNEIGHSILNVIGFIPFFGDIADLVNGLWYLSEKNYFEAFTCLVGALPFLGDMFSKSYKISKFGRICNFISNGGKMIIGGKGAYENLCNIGNMISTGSGQWYDYFREGGMFVLNAMTGFLGGAGVVNDLRQGMAYLKAVKGIDLKKLGETISGYIPFQKIYNKISSAWQNFKNNKLLPWVNSFKQNRTGKSGSSSNGISDYKEYDIVPYDNSKYRTPGFEKHHGVLNEWAEHNIPGYTKKNAPTILLSKEKHGLTKTVYQEWLRENYGKPVGISPDWGNMSKAEAMKLTNDMFDAANVPQNVRMEYFELFDIFITGG